MKTISLLFAALVGIAQAAEYTSLMSVEDLILRADNVVQGTVINRKYGLNDAGLITTVVGLKVDDAFGPNTAATEWFELPGGTWDGVVLTVPGTPTVRVGEQVVVFVKDRKIVGHGQGLLRLDGPSAVQAALPSDVRIDVSLTAVMGGRDDIADCLVGQRQVSVDEGWSHRASINSGVLSETTRGVALSLLAGVEYRFSMCGDGQAETIDYLLVDPQGDLVAAETSILGSDSVIRFTAEQTGRYVMAVQGGAIEEAWRSRFGLNVAYR